MSIVRFLMLLSLVVWIGGIAFFAFVLAPTVFHPGILPSRQLAGAVVSRSLGILHWMGIACGAILPDYVGHRLSGRQRYARTL